MRQAQHEAEEALHKLQVESESVRKALQKLEAEKEHYVAKQSSSQELVGGDTELWWSLLVVLHDHYIN